MTATPPPADSVLWVEFVDPANPAVGLRMGYTGVSHENPPATLGRNSVGVDEPVPNGTYYLTGRQSDGHWVYEHRGDRT